jgi:hypothetical protein
MAIQWQQNFLDRRAADGKRRSHIPPIPFWTVVVRVAQLVLALLLVILTGYAASKLGSGVSLLSSRVGSEKMCAATSSSRVAWLMI